MTAQMKRYVKFNHSVGHFEVDRQRRDLQAISASVTNEITVE